MLPSSNLKPMLAFAAAGVLLMMGAVFRLTARSVSDRPVADIALVLMALSVVIGGVACHHWLRRD